MDAQHERLLAALDAYGALLRGDAALQKIGQRRAKGGWIAIPGPQNLGDGSLPVPREHVPANLYSMVTTTHGH